MKYKCVTDGFKTRGIMREILFKAKRIDNGEWVEGYYLKTYNSRGELTDRIFREFRKDGNKWGFLKSIQKHFANTPG